jgi:cell wall-associated NlpC family hydrolase
MNGDSVTRALSARGHGIQYVLGHGGWHPDDPTPTRDLGCDCSGFVAWVIGICRQTGDEQFRWVETTAIVHDALGDTRYFSHVRWTDAQPGDLVVYGDRRDADGSRHQGHCGIVTAVDTTGPLKVCHCSKGASLAQGDAIIETSPDAWRARGIVARFNGGVA